jgi:monoamine oxidase
MVASPTGAMRSIRCGGDYGTAVTGEVQLGAAAQHDRNGPHPSRHKETDGRARRWHVSSGIRLTHRCWFMFLPSLPAGRSYLILESRSRLGGRVLTSDALGSPIDLGASWLHHFGPSNPVTHLAWQAGATLGVPRGGRDVFISADGRAPITEHEFTRATSAYERMEEMRDMEIEQHHTMHHATSPFRNVTYQQYVANAVDTTSFYDTDCSPEACAADDSSFDSYLKRDGPSAIAASLPPTSRQLYESFVRDIECFEGAPLAQLSALHAGVEPTGVPDCNIQVASGYGHLLNDIVREHDLKYVLDTVVERIEYGAEDVVIHAQQLTPSTQPPSQHGSSAHPNSAPHAPVACGDGNAIQSYRAKYCIVTVPLGVLKRQLITFEPPLPDWKRQAIDALGFGLLNKIVLQFDRPFWKDANVLAVLQESHPLWIVNLSPTLQAMERMKKRQVENGETKHGLAWQQYLANAAPLAPVIQFDQEIVGEMADSKIPAADAASSTSAASSSVPTIDESYKGPHILVSFHHNFDSNDAASSSHEARSDAELIDQLMSQLRRAFQGGVDKKVTADVELPSHTVHTGTVENQSFIVASTLVTLDSTADSAPLSLPHAYHFPVPSFTAVDQPAVIVPDPIGYMVTRWGLEPYSHGAYAHYKPGSGMHTSATLSRPVGGASDGVTRLLFAGEATLGVHIGCVDSAWLSGVREAKRIRQLFSACANGHANTSTDNPIPQPSIDQ